ncbi:MAG: polar amino acid ABC transporter ATP-binding protein, partial [Firmicutes bacterium HGW-Firmicutes-5]
MSMVKLVNVRKSFGDLEVLKGVNLEVSQGEVVCIIGASGSGKSTMLRCLNQLERISDGEIYIEDVLTDKR